MSGSGPKCACGGAWGVNQPNPAVKNVFRFLYHAGISLGFSECHSPLQPLVTFSVFNKQ